MMVFLMKNIKNIDTKSREISIIFLHSSITSTLKMIRFTLLCSVANFQCSALMTNIIVGCDLVRKCVPSLTFAYLYFILK